jgi:hypothetical protein
VDYLLPKDVQPLSYVVHLVTYLQKVPALTPKFSFTGHVQIRVRVKRSVTQIRMHARDLLIQDIDVTKVTEKQKEQEIIFRNIHLLLNTLLCFG